MKTAGGETAKFGDYVVAQPEDEIVPLAGAMDYAANTYSQVAGRTTISPVIPHLQEAVGTLYREARITMDLQALVATMK